MNPTVSVCRRLFCRKGYGVHSPFAFDLLTHVIEERWPYYFYRDIEAMRRQLLQSKRTLSRQERSISVRKALRRQGISQQEAKLLFRLANYCKPLSILTLGSSMGLIPLSLSGYASGLRCLTLESDTAFASLAHASLPPEIQARVEIRTGDDYERLLPEALDTLSRIDFLYLDRALDATALEHIFQRCRAFMHHKSVCLVGGIRTSPAKYRQWRQLGQQPEITLTVDLYTSGLFFFLSGIRRCACRSYAG
ncbi:MAG: hypothetical protein LBD27_06720 [Tannerella sp.]|jgi:predicted O-methyltransferase YrrM|nr:hypothetical protein [Tannerella sp.]